MSLQLIWSYDEENTVGERVDKDIDVAVVVGMGFHLIRCYIQLSMLANPNWCSAGKGDG